MRLIRKDRGSPDAGHHMNLMQGRVVGEADFGTTWTLYVRLDAPGAPAQGEYDLEIEVPRLVYEILDLARDRQCSWMAILAAIDAALLLRMARMPRGWLRVSLAVIATASTIVLANWGIAAAQIVPAPPACRTPPTRPMNTSSKC